MPTTWAEWKHKTSLLDNQWRWFQDTQLKAATSKPSLFRSPPVVTSTAATSSFSRPSAAAMSPAPQPMDLDCTNLVKKDPHSGLCFNCGKLGHITKVSMDTLDCTYHCNQTSPPMSQSNKRKATPRQVKKPLATVPPPAIYILSKNSPRSLNIQVKLTSLTSLASISMSALLDSGATGMFINQSFMQKHQLATTPLPQPVLVPNVNSSTNENGSVIE